MKRIALIVLAALLFAACQKEESSQVVHNRTAEVALTGTSWVGNYDDNFQEFPATLTWSLDFLTDSTGTIHLDLVVAAQPQPSTDIAFKYTMDGTEGTTYSENMSGHGQFTYDSISHTIIMNMQIGDGNISLGGITTFYPKGETHDAFPTNTSWSSEQQLQAGDTLMPVEWGLDFWEYGWGGQVNYCANGTCCGTSFLWQYDSATHTGRITINGATYPFSYDPSTELLTLEYTTSLYGTDVTIGGVLRFTADSSRVSRWRL